MSTPSVEAYNYHENSNNNTIIISNKVLTTTLVIPQLCVDASQLIVSFMADQLSKLLNISFGININLDTIEITEYHLFLLSLFCLSYHSFLKQKRKSKELQMKLKTILGNSRLKTLEVIANLDEKNGRRSESIYYKNSITNYNMECLTRREQRAYFEQIFKLCSIVSDLSLKILEASNELLKKYALQRINKEYEERKQKNSQNKLQLKLVKSDVHSRHAMTELQIEKFEAFFEDKSSLEYLWKKREIEKRFIAQEISDDSIHISYGVNHEQVTKIEDEDIVIGNVHKFPEIEEIEREEDLCDYSYFTRNYGHLPIEQINLLDDVKYAPNGNLVQFVSKMKLEIEENYRQQLKKEKLKHLLIGFIASVGVALIGSGVYYYQTHYRYSKSRKC